MTEPQRCAFVRPDGTHCRVKLTIQPDGLCRAHSPLTAAAMREGRAKGGRNAGLAKRRAKAADPGSVPKAPKTLDDAIRWASWAAVACADGTIDARTAHEVGYLLNAFRGALEKRDLEREVRELKALLKEATGK